MRDAWRPLAEAQGLLWVLDRWPPHHHMAEVLTLALGTDEDKVAGEAPPRPGRAPGSAAQPLECISSCSGDRRGGKRSHWPNPHPHPPRQKT